jgi:tetratricopeptide (TPR) repeat protein
MSPTSRRSRRITTRCLSWNASDRPAISEIRETLEKLLALEEARVGSLRREARPVATSRRPKLLVAASVLVLIASALVIALRPAAPGPTAVALVPFEVENPSPASETLSAFSADGLTAGLQAAPGIRVSVVEPDLRAKPDGEILRALGAQWLLRGSVSLDAGVFSFRPELSRADGSVALREAVQGQQAIESLDIVRRKVLKTLGAPTDLPAIASLRTASLDAYRLYLEARSHHDGWFADGDIEKARSLYQQALKLDGSFTSALAGQALASTSRFLSARDAGDMAVARYASERALALGEDLPDAHIARAPLFAAEEKWDEARNGFARAFELAPGDYASRRNAADLYEMLGRNEDAEEIYGSLVEEQPLHWINHYWYGRFLYRTGKLKAAAVYLERARDLHPDAVGPVTLLGFCHLASGDLDQARQEFERALSLSSSPARASAWLIHYYAGEFDRALEHWLQVLEAEPERPTSHMEVADALRQLGRTSEAKRHYQHALELYANAIELEPEDELVAQRAQVLGAIGRCAEARTELEPILARHPGNPDFLYYGALTAGRCRLDDWASELVLESIGAGNVVGIWFDPDLARVRLDPRVRRPLELIGSPE